TVERADAIEEKIVLETLIAATIDEADNAERPRPDIAIIVGAELVAFAPFPVVLNERAIRIGERVEEVKVVVRVETPSVDLRVGAEAAAPEREGDAAVDGGFAEIPRRGRFGTARIDVARLIGEQAPTRKIAILTEDRSGQRVFDVAIAAAIREFAARRGHAAAGEFETRFVDAASSCRRAHDIE